MNTYVDHTQSKASIQIYPGETRASSRFTDVAYEDLEPRVRTGSTRLTMRSLYWGWQGTTLLGIESGCGAGPRIDDDMYVRDVACHNSPELPVWQWKLIWVLLGYGLHMAAQIDLTLEPLWESMSRNLAESDDEDEADLVYAKERWDFYRGMRVDLEHARRLWNRVQILIREVVWETTDDAFAAYAWILDPIPKDS